MRAGHPGIQDHCVDEAWQTQAAADWQCSLCPLGIALGDQWWSLGLLCQCFCLHPGSTSVAGTPRLQQERFLEGMSCRCYD